MKKLKVFLLFGFVAVVMLALTGCGSSTINLNKYVTIEASGYNSVGTISYKFDEDALCKDYSGKIKVNSKNSAELAALGMSSGDSAVALMLEFCVDYDLDKTTGLSNGDVVTLKWDCDDEQAKESFNCKLKYSDITYEVSGLKEAGSFNPYDYVKVSFSGTAPDGKVVITPDKNRAEMQDIQFTADRETGLKNGDQITITASTKSAADDFVEKFGSVLGKSEETYTVEGLSQYVTDISNVPSDMYDKMDKQLQDVLKSDFASWDGETLSKMELLGTYTITKKESMSDAYGDNNYIYFVYKVSAKSSEPKGNYEYYWYGYYTNVIVLADGTCSVDLSSYKTPSTGWFSDEEVSFGDDGPVYYGYKDLDSLFNKHVVSKVEEYEYKSTIKQ